MSTGSKIEWCKHTFNPWWGCTKVHDGCKHCYAEATDNRWGGDHWGPRAARRMILGEWSKPDQWNREAQAAGVMDRVFCASMCDLFEDFYGPVVDQRGDPVMCPPIGKPWTVPMLRQRTLYMVQATPWLDWLLLTKRPENVVGMVPEDWHDNWPTNVMVGTSPCDQKTADTSIPALLKVPGRRFLSQEPQLGPVVYRDEWAAGLHWIVGGGESGPGARPYDLAWPRETLGWCRRHGIPYFQKQLGANPYIDHTPPHAAALAAKHGVGPLVDEFFGLRDRKGGDMAEWPEDLRVREWPTNTPPTGGKERGA